ncbi:MAG: nucleotidyl transferase AbiEii/AbiGii toxin family protein [Myxococcota bacterium]
MERFLYRLSTSPHRARFVLKGALMLYVWEAPLARATKDLDFLGRLDSSPENLARVVREICTADVEPDGIVFDPTTVKTERIKEDADYEGVRVRFVGLLGKARVTMQIDVGFGDVVTPGAIDITYPTLLDFPAPGLAGYPRETVIAEKLQAMVYLRTFNSRMKDFYDVWVLARQFALRSRPRRWRSGRRSEGSSRTPSVRRRSQRWHRFSRSSCCRSRAPPRRAIPSSSAGAPAGRGRAGTRPPLKGQVRHVLLRHAGSGLEGAHPRFVFHLADAELSSRGRDRSSDRASALRTSPNNGEIPEFRRSLDSRHHRCLARSHAAQALGRRRGTDPVPTEPSHVCPNPGSHRGGARGADVSIWRACP